MFNMTSLKNLHLSETLTILRFNFSTYILYFQVYHWPESCAYDPETKTGGLFTGFVNAFLKLKQESSGFPSWCTTDQDKDIYIHNYAEQEGIHMDTNNIKKNPGKRALAKLLLNSFWGKFAQRTNLTQTKYIYDQVDFLRHMLDPVKTVKDFHIIKDDVIALDYEFVDKQVPDTPQSNIVVAAFTTCWARLKLLDVLHTIDRKCLYFDTDSVIYVDDGTVDIPLGDYLGELTDELDGDHITEFVSGGPKNYAFITSSGNTTCKVKGFTLNYINSQVMNFDVMRDLVLYRPTDKVSMPKASEIRRNKWKRTLDNRESSKDYQLVYTKRRRLANLDTEPYGY